MSLRKKGCLPQNTEAGQTEWAAGIFFLLFLGVLLCSLLQVELFKSSSQYLEDALAMSNLASAVVDVEEYGISHRLLVSDPEQAYERYQTAVRGNLNLDDNWECPGRALISGPVQVVKYILYNVSGSQVDIYFFDENGLMTSWREVLGSAVAPDGSRIESTGVYSEITYQVEGLFGIHTQAWKGKLVDVVAQGEAGAEEGVGKRQEGEPDQDQEKGEQEAVQEADQEADQETDTKRAVDKDNAEGKEGV